MPERTTDAIYRASLARSCMTCRVYPGAPCINIASGGELAPPQVHAMRLVLDLGPHTTRSAA
jgi:hypothetical protein